MRNRIVSPSQLSCSIAIVGPNWPEVRARPSLMRRTASTLPRLWLTVTVMDFRSRLRSLAVPVCVLGYYDRTAILSTMGAWWRMSAVSSETGQPAAQKENR
jgi:hypothetical protein